MRSLVILCAAVLFPIAGCAQDLEQAQTAMARELAQCGGYYFALAVREGAPSQPTEVSDAFMERGKRALAMAKEYARDEQQVNEIGGSTAELCLIEGVRSGWEKTNRLYAEPCNSLLEDPETRFRELQRK